MAVGAQGQKGRTIHPRATRGAKQTDMFADLKNGTNMAPALPIRQPATIRRVLKRLVLGAVLRSGVDGRGGGLAAEGGAEGR